METELGELEAQLNNAKAPLPRMHPNLAQLYRRQAERLEAALQDASTRDEALTLVRSLIGHVAVHVRDEGFEIELEGEIAMSVDANNDKAALHGRLLDDGTRCSIKVVAEA